VLVYHPCYGITHDSWRSCTIFRNHHHAWITLNQNLTFNNHNFSLSCSIHFYTRALWCLPWWSLWLQLWVHLWYSSGWTTPTLLCVECQHLMCSNYSLPRIVVLEICDFQRYASLAWICLFTPRLGVKMGKWHLFTVLSLCECSNLGLTYVNQTLEKSVLRFGLRARANLRSQIYKNHVLVIFHPFAGTSALGRSAWILACWVISLT